MTTPEGRPDGTAGSDDPSPGPTSAPPRSAPLPEDPRYQDPRHEDPRYEDPRYEDPQHEDPQHEDQEPSEAWSERSPGQPSSLHAPSPQRPYQDGAYPQGPHQHDSYPQRPYQHGASPAGPGHDSGSPPRRGTDGFAIAALVFAILSGILLAVVFAVIALRRIRRTGAGGRGVAIAALVVSGLWLLLIGTAVAAYVVFSPERSESGEITGGGRIRPSELRVGDCVKELDQGRITQVPVVPCAEPHQGEAVYELFLMGAGYPGEDTVIEDAEDRCAEEIPDPVVEQADDRFVLFYLYPGEREWEDGDRQVLCLLLSEGDPVSGSFVLGDIR